MTLSRHLARLGSTMLVALAPRADAKPEAGRRQGVGRRLAQRRADHDRRRGRREPPFMPKTKALLEDQGATLRRTLHQLSLVLPVARLDPARPVRAQHQHRRQRAALGRLRDVPRARARAVDARDLAAGGRLPHGDDRQVSEPLRAGEGRRAARLGRVVRRRQRACELRLRPQRERPHRRVRRRARGLSERRADRQGGRGDRDASARPTSRSSSTSCPTPAQPVGRGAAPRGHVRRRGAAADAFLRRGRRQRQAGLHPQPAAARRGPDRLSRGRVPAAPRSLQAIDDMVESIVGRSRRPASSTTPTSSTARTTAFTWASTG